MRYFPPIDYFQVSFTKITGSCFKDCIRENEVTINQGRFWWNIRNDVSFTWDNNQKLVTDEGWKSSGIKETNNIPFRVSLKGRAYIKWSLQILIWEDGVHFRYQFSAFRQRNRLKEEHTLKIVYLVNWKVTFVAFTEFIILFSNPFPPNLAYSRCPKYTRCIKL